jgi:hypothetical protein
MSNSENGMDFSSEDFILTGENLMALDTPVNLVALPADIAEKIDDFFKLYDLPRDLF